jgi:predicted Zn-dependent peptidase
MSTETLAPQPTTPEPARARPVFSTEDFALLREAVAAHLRTVADSPDSVKFSNLYHRLGRLG